MDSTTTTNITPPFSISNFPDEIILEILSYLDVPDLLSVSRINHHIRTLSLDPLLHSSRLARASTAIERYIPRRRPLTELLANRIYVTRTSLAARRLGRNLISIKLNRQLLKRPSAETLVEKGVLPGECYGGGKVKGMLAPSLVETKRKIEKEKVKDVLRHWLEEWRRKGIENVDVEELPPNVRRIARRFARDRDTRDAPRWGTRVESKEMPTRAKVLHLKTFWEKLERDSGRDF